MFNWKDPASDDFWRTEVAEMPLRDPSSYLLTKLLCTEDLQTSQGAGCRGRGAGVL